MKIRDLIIACSDRKDYCYGCPYTKECKIFTDLNGNQYPSAAHPFLDMLDEEWLESEVDKNDT